MATVPHFSRRGRGRTRPRFAEAHLRVEMMRLRRVNRWTNLTWLAVEWTCIAAVIAGAVGFAEYRSSLGLGWGWNVPVFGLAIILIGGLQHRLAGLGHEASHYTFVDDKFTNDLAADLFCMFPLFTTIHFYRLFHMAHHQYTNDPARDPDLVNMGRSKKVHEFPMSRSRFVALYYLRVLVAPLSFLKYQFDYIYVNVFGKGNNVYMGRVSEGDAGTTWPRLGTILGLAYLLGFNVLLWRLTSTGHGDLMWPVAVLGIAVAAIGVRLMPSWAEFHSPFRQPYSTRFASTARLAYYILLMTGLAWIRKETDGASAKYVMLLWNVPLMTTFMLYMLLRDVYQHANADDGRLTNSRVFFTDPFTHWAVFVYGQDMHVPHHLFPAIPHYHLRELHELLREAHEDYADQVVECRGTFANGRDDLPTILDVLTREDPSSRSHEG